MKRKAMSVGAGVVMFSLCFLPLACSAGGWLELDVTRYDRGTYSSSLLGGTSGWSEWDNRVGYYVFGQVIEGGYKQLYAGPRFHPMEGLEFGVALGAEHIPGLKDEWSLRRAGYIVLSTEALSASATFEVGKSGDVWHKAMLTYTVNPEWKLGLMNQTSLGTGIRAQYALNKDVSIWGAVLRDDDQLNSVIAIQFCW